MVFAAHFRSCLNLKEELTKQGLPHDWNVGWNESLITRGRNEMAKAFLDKTDWSHLFWLDADIEFEPEDVAKVWNLGADIGVAFYCMKQKAKPLSAWKDGKLVEITDQKEPFEVDYAGTGFMCIKREVFDALAATSEWYEGPQGKTYAFFQDPIVNYGQESEDYNFCRKAQNYGFRIIGDPSIKLGHYGLYRYGAE